MSTIHDLPSEVLEVIFSHLPHAQDQQKLSLVCKKWHAIIQVLRTLPSLPGSKFRQNIYLRLPAAGAYNESHGNEGFAVIFHTLRDDILLSGVAVFLPHPQENEQLYDKLKISIKLMEHGVSQIGPVGPDIVEKSVQLSKTEVTQWAGPKGCSRKVPEKSTLQCLPGDDDDATIDQN